MGILNYNPQEASNLSLGQGGFDVFSDSVNHAITGANRWVSVFIADGGGTNDIVLTSNVGDDLTIDSSAVPDLVGTIVNGDFNTVNAGGSQLICYKG